MSGIIMARKTGASMKAFCGALAVSLFCLTPVWADDTEIFFGDIRGGGAAPNVLFIMDTSGSMTNRDGTGVSRIDRVKQALRELVNNLNDVNIGLMRFSNPGGPVLYPVSYIDERLQSNSGEIISVSSGVGSGDADAQEVVGSGEVLLSGESLFMPVSDTSPDLGRGEWVVEETSDDAEENLSYGGVEVDGNCNRNNDNDSCTMLLSRNSMVGLRFRNVGIPAGATIESANLRLTTSDGRHRTPDWDGEGFSSYAWIFGQAVARIYGELNDSGTFSTSYRNISSRINDGTERTAAVDWEIPRLSNDQEVRSVDIKNVIQEIVNQSAWDGSDASVTDNITLTMQLTDTGFWSDYIELYLQTADYAQRWNGNAAVLEVEFTTGAAPEAQQFVTGLHFSDVGIPRGVDITDARLEFTVDQIDDGQSTSLSIAMEDSTDPSSFSASAGNISGRTTSGSVAWSDIPSWNQTDAQEQSVDISSLVQNMVSRAGWCGGNSMNFILEGDAGLRIAKAFEGDASGAARLQVQYDRDSLVPGTSCIAKEERRNILSSRDDGTAPAVGSPVTTGESRLVIDDEDIALLRFTGVELLDTAEITSAYLRVTAASGATGTTNFSISAENTGNADGIRDGVSGRGFTSPVYWETTADWVEGGSYQSSDIASIIRTIIGNNSWESGNAMLLRVAKASGSTRTIKAVDDNTQIEAAQLIINYIDDGSEGARTVRDELLDAVDSLSASGNTPIQDTIFEAYQYLTGGDVVWGRFRGAHDEDGNRISVAGGGPFAYTRVSNEKAIVPDTYQVVRPYNCDESNLGSWYCVQNNGPGEPQGEYLAGSPKYKTPIDDYCQFESHIIMLTDGIANSPHSQDNIQAIDGIDSCSSDVNNAERCVKELVHLMNTEDISPLQEKQTVTTHTIGFNFSSLWLADVAEAGGGVYKEANDAVGLVQEIKAIVSGALKTDTSFVAPVAAINQFNRLNHLNEVYFAVFRPEGTPRWPGNLKKYKLGEYNGKKNVILDYNSQPAISEATGFFKEEARSAWTNTPDGYTVDDGGAGENVPVPGSRHVYTYLQSQEGQPTVLSRFENRVVDGNDRLTSAMLGIPNGDRANLINWIRGQDTEDNDGDEDRQEQRYSISDPLHSKPVAITYNFDNPNDPDVTVFMGTNAGFLHAIDAGTGAEQFAFIPEELLSRQAALRRNSDAQSHIYGMDGSVSPWVHDNGNNGIDASDPKDFVYIYSGMRRGGRSYYALDVTDRANPEILWTIHGGSGDFAELGQTWGRPIPGRIKLEDEDPVDVLYISGGYDPGQDDNAIQAPATYGRALYIVNARTGELIWSGGPDDSFTRTFPDMEYSIPATLTVADVDANGLDDMIFVGDTGGQVWRFDIGVDKSIANLVRGGVIADLGVAGGDNTAARNRRFYHAPDVALVDGPDGKELAVTIGSGLRPHPLDKQTQDRFYMLRQHAVFGPPASYVKLTESDLFDTSLNLIAEGTEEEADAAKTSLAEADGWFFDMPRTGEKVLSTPLAFRNTVTFTSYEPSNEVSSCIAKAGTSRVYQVYLKDGTPVNNWHTVDSNLTTQDRSYDLNSASIIDEPVVICTGDGCELFVGAEQPELPALDEERIVKTFWRKDS